MHIESFKHLLHENWRSGITVAFISVPLSIAISIASGAGPVPGVIAGVWGTIIASFFGGSNYNIIGAAGALTTVLFAAALSNPLGIGAAVLPLLAIVSGLIILVIWFFDAYRFLYYVPTSVMYGFAAGVAVLIAISQLFDALGLSGLTRTGHVMSDLALVYAHVGNINVVSCIVFAAALAAILIWKRTIQVLPAVIPIAIIGIVFGYAAVTWWHLPVITLHDRFGAFSVSLIQPPSLHALLAVGSSYDALLWLLQTAAVVSLIGVLETLITAKIGDVMTKTQSSYKKELFGLALANIGSGVCGGLPATGVFIRAGANIKAGATHRTSALVAGVATGAIALVVLPLFAFIPMAVIAAILINTALGLIEHEKILEFWHHERSAFVITMLVLAVTVLHDAGLAVLLGALASLLLFADSVSRGRFDAVITYADGTYERIDHAKVLHFSHERDIAAITYSIAGFLCYIDSERHAANFRHIARSPQVRAVIIRLRDLFSMDYEGKEMLAEAVAYLREHDKELFISSMREDVEKEIREHEGIVHNMLPDHYTKKTEDALKYLGVIK